MTCDNPLHLIPLLILVGGILFFVAVAWSCGWWRWRRYPPGCVPSVRPLGPPPIPPMRKLAGENPDPPPVEFRPDPPPNPPPIPPR